MNREIKVGRKFRLANHKRQYVIVVDSVINGVVGHHIQGGVKLGGINCMTCTDRMFNGYLRAGRLI